MALKFPLEGHKTRWRVIYACAKNRDYILNTHFLDIDSKYCGITLYVQIVIGQVHSNLIFESFDRSKVTFLLLLLENPP